MTYHFPNAGLTQPEEDVTDTGPPYPDDTDLPTDGRPSVDNNRSPGMTPESCGLSTGDLMGGC